MDAQELQAWLRLTLTPGVGNATARKLLAAFGSAQAVFDQSGLTLRQVVSDKLSSALQTEPPALATQLQTTLDWLQAGSDRRVATLGDAAYPTALLDIEDPPLMLYMLGTLCGRVDTAAASAPSLAIVGSRNPTPQGEVNARQFAKAFGEAGLCVISGLALGIDGAAHDGALLGGGDTIAVVGTGLDRVYPKKHLALAHRIARQGMLISEFPLGTPPLTANFPKRNRIISGLSLGTLVVEAALKSGSLITARLAAEQGKEVFAIPGSIHSPQSRGCHALIKQGAKLVEVAQDVLEELRLTPASAGRTCGAAPDQLDPASDNSNSNSNDTNKAPAQTARSSPARKARCWRRWVLTRSAWMRCRRAAGCPPISYRPNCWSWNSTARSLACRAACSSGLRRREVICVILASCLKSWCTFTKITGRARPAPSLTG